MSPRQEEWLLLLPLLPLYEYNVIRDDGWIVGSCSANLQADSIAPPVLTDL
jgi:hypothetical protein